MPELILSAGDDSLIGRYVVAAGARTQRAGVVLPPRPGARRLRLAVDDGPVVLLDPSWAIDSHPSLMRERGSQKVVSLQQRVKGRPTYRFGDLPAKHLATKTMLREEHRRQPAPGQQPIAWYSVYRDWAPLYAIADTAAMPALSQKRTQAWHAARTCSVCAQEFGRPLERSPEPECDRYCAPCHQATAEARWIEAARPVQAEMAAWAREVLADPLTVLGARRGYEANQGRHGHAFHVETVTGDVLLSVTPRSFEDLADSQYPEYYRDTVYVGDLLEPIRRISQLRIITWYGGDLNTLPNGLWRLLDEAGQQLRTHTADTDRLVERYRLWTGVSPAHRNGWWYPQPQLPWNSTGSGELERGYRTAQTAKDEVRWMREYLRRMAFETPPEPTIHGRGPR